MPTVSPWVGPPTAANRHDSILFQPTLDSAAHQGLLLDVETLHLDRAYNSKAVRALCEAAGITDVICAKKRPRGQANHTKQPTPLGLRWTVERTNSCSPTTGSSAATPTDVSNTG